MERQLASIMVESGLDHFKAERAAKRMIDFINHKLEEEIKSKTGLSKKERSLVCDLLQMASNEFANHGCNDVDKDTWEEWTIEERKDFVKSYYEFNGEPHEFDENHLELTDWELINFMIHKLKHV